MSKKKRSGAVDTIHAVPFARERDRPFSCREFQDS